MPKENSNETRYEEPSLNIQFQKPAKGDIVINFSTEFINYAQDNKYDFAEFGFHKPSGTIAIKLNNNQKGKSLLNLKGDYKGKNIGARALFLTLEKQLKKLKVDNVYNMQRMYDSTFLVCVGSSKLLNIKPSKIKWLSNIAHNNRLHPFMNYYISEDVGTTLHFSSHLVEHAQKIGKTNVEFGWCDEQNELFIHLNSDNKGISLFTGNGTLRNSIPYADSLIALLKNKWRKLKEKEMYELEKVDDCLFKVKLADESNVITNNTSIKRSLINWYVSGIDYVTGAENNKEFQKEPGKEIHFNITTPESNPKLIIALRRRERHTEIGEENHKKRFKYDVHFLQAAYEYIRNNHFKYIRIGYSSKENKLLLHFNDSKGICLRKTDGDYINPLFKAPKFLTAVTKYFNESIFNEPLYFTYVGNDVFECQFNKDSSYVPKKRRKEVFIDSVYWLTENKEEQRIIIPREKKKENPTIGFTLKEMETIKKDEFGNYVPTLSRSLQFMPALHKHIKGISEEYLEFGFNVKENKLYIRFNQDKGISLRWKNGELIPPSIMCERLFTSVKKYFNNSIINKSLVFNQLDSNTFECCLKNQVEFSKLSLKKLNETNSIYWLSAEEHKRPSDIWLKFFIASKWGTIDMYFSAQVQKGMVGSNKNYANIGIDKENQMFYLSFTDNPDGLDLRKGDGEYKANVLIVTELFPIIREAFPHVEYKRQYKGKKLEGSNYAFSFGNNSSEPDIGNNKINWLY